MAPHTDDLKMLRVVVREDFTKNRCDLLIVDIKLCQGLLEQTDKETIKRQEDFIRAHTVNSSQSTHNHSKYRVSLLYSPPFSFSADLGISVFDADCAIVEGETFASGKTWEDACYLLKR